MKALKNQFRWLLLSALVVLPALAACGAPAAEPVATTAPAAEATATSAPAMAATATTAPAMEATATTGSMAADATPTAAGGQGMDSGALAAEGIKADETASGKFEFFSWWTAGGEAEGKNDILNLYKKLYPKVEVVDAAVAGGGGDKAKGVLKTRMQGNDAPDTFQVHGGPELIDGYVKAGRMEPVTQLYKDMRMDTAFPKQLLEIVSNGGEIYAVPANIHRGNELFYNKKVFTDNGITAPKTWEDFLAAADKLKAKNIPAIAVGGKDPWAVTMLFEDILIAKGGPDKFKDLMAGKADWSDQSVLDSLALLQKIWSGNYQNKDFAALTWDEAAGLVLKGQAGMTIMGDWAKGYFQANDPTWSTDIGWAPSPGNEGVFKVITDAFGLPKGAKNPENTKKFLALIGSKTGQVTFNLRKGSIPARTDVDTSKFDVYMKDAAQAFSGAKAIVGSAPHGSATVEAFSSALTTAINQFISNPVDAAAAAKALQASATDLLGK